MTIAVGYDPAELTNLVALEQRHFWFVVRRQIIIDALHRHFSTARDYLELGSGTGYVAQGIRHSLPEYRVVASDPLTPGIMQVNALDIPFTDVFDVVGAYDVLEHIEDDRAALDQMRRACRPGGGVLLTVPQHPRLWSSADNRSRHVRRYTRADLAGKLSAAGFQILGLTSFNSINLPVFLLRLALLRAGARDIGDAVPPAPLNRLLALGMQLDRCLIRAGIALPAGGSLLIAASRR